VSQCAFCLSLRLPGGLATGNSISSATVGFLVSWQVVGGRSAHDDKPLTAAQARQRLRMGLLDYLAGNAPGPVVFRLKRIKNASETYPHSVQRVVRVPSLACICPMHMATSRLEPGAPTFPDRWVCHCAR
jgi:hypothetical protein